MKKKTFINLSLMWAVVWAVFAGISWYYKLGLGTVATLGGIALMFAWMAEQEKVKGN